MLKRSILAAVAAAAFSSAAHATTVTTLLGGQGWYTGYDSSSSYAALPGSINTDHPQSGNGSAKLNTTGGATKSVIGYFGTGLGTLGNLTSLAFDYLRDSSSTDPDGTHAPTFKLYVNNGTSSASLTWERVYNQVGNTPLDTFVNDSNLLNEKFYISSGGNSYDNDDNFRTIGDYANGYQAKEGGLTAVTLSASTVVTGIELGAGSGWSGTFNGYVDNVSAQFSNTAGVSANFETASAVPLPAAAWAGIALLGKLGFTRRRRD